MRIYTVANESQYVGLCDGEGDRTFTLDQLSVREGCTVFLEPTTNAWLWEGGTGGANCASSLRGYLPYATSVVTLKNDSILSWDQGLVYRGSCRSAEGCRWSLRIHTNRCRTSAMNPDDLGNDDINTDDGDDDIDEDELETMVGETCVDAPALVEASESLNGTGSTYRYQLSSATSVARTIIIHYKAVRAAQHLGCSLVYDAIGRDTVFSIVLQPGETLALRALKPNRRTLLRASTFWMVVTLRLI